jgi:hypothetical protein
MSKIANSLGLFIGTLGIAISIYTYNTTKTEKIISYNIGSESFKIFDNELIGKSQKITVLKNDSNKVKENIYLSTFSIWNSGNTTIDPKDVRKEIVIKFNGIKEILEYSILKEIDPKLSKFDLNKISSNSFRFKWKYFDPNDGLKIQLLFTGSPNLNVEIDSKIINTKINEYVPIRKKPNTISILIFGTIIIIFIFLWIFKIYNVNDLFTIYWDKGDSYSSMFINIGIVIIISIIVLYLVLTPYFYYLYFTQADNNPF